MSNDWVDTPEEILARLRSPSPRDRQFAALFAETVAFEKADLRKWLDALYDFIKKERFCKTARLKVAVGSAARKYAMNMTEDDFESYSDLFDTALSDEIVLELAKGVFWRLKFYRFDKRSYPRLIKSLSEVVKKYTHPDLFVSTNSGAIALNAITALVILHTVSSDVDNAKLVIRGDYPEWFADLISHRLDQTICTIEKHDPDLANQIRHCL